MYQDSKIARAVTVRCVTAIRLIMETVDGLSTSRAFAKRLGVKEASFSKWITGSGNITLPDLFNLCSQFRVSPGYLILGEGDILLKGPSDQGGLESQLKSIKTRLREIEILACQIHNSAAKERNKKPEQTGKNGLIRGRKTAKIG